MRNYGTQAVDRALSLLTSIIADKGQTSIANIGRMQALAPATTYRIASALVKQGFLIPVGRGRLVAGLALVALASAISLRPALVALGRPAVKRLARETRSIAHLGILEQDMVTYLIKAGRGSDANFTEEGKQLEAYCSGIGKALLAGLPSDEQDDYLASGPFVALTPHTITAPDELARELARVRAQGFSRDAQEVALGLHCLAVAVHDPSGAAIAALSVSRNRLHDDEAGTLEMMRAAVTSIEHAIFGAASLPT